MLVFWQFRTSVLPSPHSRVSGHWEWKSKDFLGNTKRATSFVEDTIEFDSWLIAENPLNYTEEALARMRKDLMKKKETLRPFSESLVHKELELGVTATKA